MPRSLLPLVLVSVALLVDTPASALVELASDARARFQWAPATGPVAGYRVYLSTNGGPDALYGSVVGGATSETIGPAPGDTIVVSVVAFDAEGREGPRSAASEPVHFASPAPPPPAEEPPPPPTEEPAPPPAEEPPPPPADSPPAEEPAPPPAEELPPPPAEEPAPPPAEEPPAAEEPAPPPVAEAGPPPRDFDGDGLSDVLMRQRRSGELRVLLLHGAQVASELPLPGLPGDLAVLATGDYDGNGVADVLGRDTSGQLQTWLLESGVPMGPVALGEPLPEGAEVVGSSDIDVDGRSDLLVRVKADGQSALEIWYMEGGGVREILEISDAPGRGWRVAGTGDYTGDGAPDVLWQRRRSGELLLWELRDGVVHETALSAVAPRTKLRGVGDLDGDGRADVVLRLAGARTWFSARMLSDGLATPVPLPGAALGLQPVPMASGDFDGDGRGDLVVKDRLSKLRFVSFGSPDGPEGAEALPPLERGWRETGGFD